MNLSINKKDLNKALSRILIKAEENLGLYNVNGRNIEPLDIIQFCLIIRDDKLSEKDRNVMFLNLSDNLSSLLFLNNLLNFDKIVLLDFNSYERTNMLVSMLEPLLNRNLINKKTLKHSFLLIDYLKINELKNIKCKNSLTYRFIRLLIVCLYREDFLNGRIIAEFLYNQCTMSDKYSDDVKSFDEEIKKLNSNFIEESNKFINTEDKETIESIKPNIEKVKEGDVPYEPR